MVGVGCAGVEEAPTHLRWHLPVGAATGTHPSVRGGIRRHRERSSRDRRRSAGVVGTVLQTRRPGRRGECTAKLAEFYQREGRDPTPIERGAIGREAALDTRTVKSGQRCRRPTRPVAHRSRQRRGHSQRRCRPSIVTPPRWSHRSPSAVSVGEVVEVLAQRSSWHRLDVVRALCDGAPPVTRMSIVAGWARVLERHADRILDVCVDIDPSGVDRRRRSDGRSVWIAPIETHFTNHLVTRPGGTHRVVGDRHGNSTNRCRRRPSRVVAST